MKATLIFDSVNDLVFSKWDETFIQRMKTFGEQEESENLTDNHNVSQLLSPIITSQRVMAAQFGNTYSSMQCKDNTTIVFDEHICGQNLNLLHSPIYQDWLSVLLESRGKGDSIPGASGVIGESGATGAALNALKTTAKDIKCSNYQHYHLMLFVGDKLLALYSSRGSEDLMPPDLILMSIQCIAAQEYWKETEKTEDSADQTRLPWLSEENSGIVNVCAGSGVPCAPHSLHLAELAPRITFVVLVDMELREVGVSAHLSNTILSNLRRLLLQRNLELLPNTLDTLEAALKKTTDALKKNKHSNLCGRLTTRMMELRKSCTTTTPLTPETTATAMHTALEAVTDVLKPDIPSLKLEQPVKELRVTMAPYLDFLRVKAMRFFSLGSGPVAESDGGSLTLHKYVEEFPGLVHFVCVDRAAGRFLAPDAADARDMLTADTTVPPRILHRNDFADCMCACTGGPVAESDGGSLTLHKYVEEFPGLVHFVCVDRAAGRFLAPDAADARDMLTADTVSADARDMLTADTVSADARDMLTADTVSADARDMLTADTVSADARDMLTADTVSDARDMLTADTVSVTQGTCSLLTR
ncbi:hypothetical protein NE865_01861 [Phthorimaea operculella]|nr:hypothetical protein NE865_01861 [Phthorimaea operculella]